MMIPRLIQDGAQEVASGLNAIADSIRTLTEALGTAGMTPEAVTEVAVVPDDPSAMTDALTDVSKWSGYIEAAKEKAIEFAPSLLGAIIIMLLGWIVARMITAILRKALGKSKLDPTLINFATSCLYFALLAFVFIAAATKLGLDTGSFVAVIGAATFAIGFALQGSLANFAAGVMLMIFRPIREGDLIEAGGVLGIVDEIGVFATVMNTLDNKRAVIANASITGGNIINYTTNGMLRVDMTFGIGYGDDMDKAIELMEAVLAQDDRVLAEPAPTVACTGHGASSVDFVCRPHVKPEHYWDVWFDTHKKVKEAFDANGVSIPYPQRDVHMIADMG
ncbi:MAG: small conductance mechanosensitive channel [Planctomycetota bacterium]|jgi:small conductance mechanosensitive channel